MKFKNKLIIFVLVFNVLCQTDRSNIIENRIRYENQFNGNEEQFEASVRIVGGDELDDRSKWPWLVAFTHNEANNYFCGGSLVSKRHALGAAHCFQNKNEAEVLPPEHVTARLGKFNLSVLNEPGSKSSWVSQISIHPDWKPFDEKFDADIAVVVLGERVEFSDFIQSVSLPPQNEDDVNGKGTIAGWGQSINSVEFNGSFEDTPIELEMPVVKGMKCLSRFPKLGEIASERMFCAGYDSETKGACFGDSGAGFYVSDSSPVSQFQVRGIVSSSLVAHQTCDVNKFSLYTNVGWFANWIKDKMKETEEIEWTEVELKCSEPEDSYVIYCSDSFAGPFNQNIRISSKPKIQNSFRNADQVERISIRFGNFFSDIATTHIFSGIGETFQNLRQLRISGTSIKFIKRYDFSNLSKLKELELSNFPITFIPEDTFIDLPALETLEIRWSQLQTLPSNLFLFSNNLIELKLVDNEKQTQIPDDLFKNAQKLKRLVIRDSPNLKHEKNSFWNLPELEVLTLSFLNLSELPENLLPNSKKLKKLDLSWNNLKKLNKKFKENIPELEVLVLDWNPIELAADSFTEFSKLKELNLKNCNLKTLPEGFFNSLSQLEVLDLKNNQLNISTADIFPKNLNLKIHVKIGTETDIIVYPLT